MLHFLRLGRMRGIAFFMSFAMLFTMVLPGTTAYANKTMAKTYKTTTWNFRGGQEGAYQDLVAGVSGSVAVSGSTSIMVPTTQSQISSVMTAMALNADNIAAASYTSAFESSGFMITATNKKKVTVDGNNKTADDGTEFHQRIKLGGTGTADYRSIKFSTSEASTVQIYAMSSSSSSDRTLSLYSTSDAEVGSAPAIGSSLVVRTIELAEAGDYYLASPSSGVNVYGVIVTSQGSVTEPERADWSSVTGPAITGVIQNDNKVVVTFELVTGDDGADKATVYMMDEAGTNVESRLVGRNTSTTIRTTEFVPEASGNYTFKVVAERTDETVLKESSVTNTVAFTLPLTTPSIIGATNIGSGSVEISWDAVKEAESYVVSYKAEDESEDSIATTVTETSAIVNGLTIGANYILSVNAVRGADVSGIAKINVTVSEEAQRPWYFSAFGQGVKTTNNYYSGSANDGSVTVASESGKGKLVPASTDGLAFYYTTVEPEEENFILSATVTVDAWTYSNGQEGFGLMAADTVGSNGDSSVFWNNSYMNSVTKVEYNWDNENQVVSDTGDKITMKLGIGAQEKLGVTAENIADGTILTNINELFQSTMTTLDNSCATSGAGTYNIVGNYQNTEAPTGSLEDINLLTTFQLKIQRDNTGYRISYTDEEGNTTTKLYYDIEREALTQIDEENIYVGFFASRNAKITITDIELTTSDPATDPPAEGIEITYITPSYQVISATATGIANYELVFLANADGVLTIKDSSDKTIVAEEAVKANTYVKENVNLTKGNNKFIVEFTPEVDFKFSEYEYLSSYDTVAFEHNVMYQYYSRKVLYVSPGGISSGTGSKSDPLDIYTATKYVKPGQMIVVAGGTYYLNRTVIVDRGISGSTNNMIYMIADPSSTKRPIFNFNKSCAGFVFAGDYWYLKGFDVTQSADAKKGLQLSGDHCILDGVNTYDNGNTGIQISRYLTSDLFEDWPSYNLVLNCTSYGNADRGYEDADGFAAKLTVGDGNVFDGCIAYNNADDGWDLFAKPETGSIGQVVIQNCVAYGNGYLPDGTNAGNGNGFKLGGSSIAGNHKLINSVSYDNKAKGIDSNSGPDIQVHNCTTFNNSSYNVALYTNDSANTDYLAEGIISFRTTDKTISENIKPKGTQDTTNIFGTTNYYWNGSSQTAVNTAGSIVGEDWFVNLNSDTTLTRYSDGTINMNELLVLTENAPFDAGARMTGTSSRDIVVPLEHSSKPTSTATPTPEIPDNNTDWSEVMKDINNSLKVITENEEETEMDPILISVDLNGETQLPAELLEVIRGRNVEITLNLGNGVSWTILGNDIAEGELQDIDLAVTLETNNISEEMIENLMQSGNNPMRMSQVSLVHNGSFNFRAELTIEVGELLEKLLEEASLELDMDRLVASLYYYNPETDTMILQSADIVNQEGRVTFLFHHASDYVIVFSDELLMDKATLAQITVNEVTIEEMGEALLYSGGTKNNTKNLLTVIPDSIQEAVDKGIIEQEVTYTTNDQSVASVSKQGMITAQEAGLAVITTKLVVDDNILEFKTEVVVKKAYVAFVKTTEKLKIGEKATFEVAVCGFAEEDLIWVTNKKKISVVGRNYGKTTAIVTGKTVGTENVYVKVQGENGSYLNTVKMTITISDPKKTEVAEKLVYIVKKGDNLWNIAKEYKCKVSDILALNDIINPDLIYRGQKIVIPR